MKSFDVLKTTYSVRKVNANKIIRKYDKINYYFCVCETVTLVCGRTITERLIAFKSRWDAKDYLDALKSNNNELMQEIEKKSF